MQNNLKLKYDTLIQEFSEEIKTIEGTNFTWINIDNPDLQVLENIGRIFNFHHLDIEDCLSKVQIPKIDEYKDYLFIILHIPRYLKDKKFAIPSQIGFFLGKDFLITVHNGDIKPINRIFQNCKEKKEIYDEFMSKSSTYLFYKLVHAMIKHIMAMLKKIMSEIEDIEETVFDKGKEAILEIADMRHNIYNMRRVVFSFKNVITDLERIVIKISNEDFSIYFSDLSDYINKAWNVLEECKETIEIFKDTDFIISSHRTNKILALLTIVFTLSIPATIIGTFYGMNVILPGGVDNPYTILGPYTTFIFICLFSILIAILMYIIFRRLKWI